MDEILLGGDTYPGLRRTLIRYLRRCGSPTAEDLADETVVRVLQNVQAGVKIENIGAYILRVARNVRLERTRQPRTVPLPPNLVAHQVPEDGELLDCLTKCLKELPKAEHSIMRTYYMGSGQELIENRRKLADKLGIPLEALRIRVYRNRLKLGKCIEACPERLKRT